MFKVTIENLKHGGSVTHEGNDLRKLLVKLSETTPTTKYLWEQASLSGTEFVFSKEIQVKDGKITPVSGTAMERSKGVSIDNLARHSAVRDLEKRIGRMEENHISLIAYLSSFHGLDINEWNDWNNNTRMLPDKVYYDKDGEDHDLRHTDTRIYPDEKTFWEVGYKDLKTGA